jgi:hypothetical protein
MVRGPRYRVAAARSVSRPSTASTTASNSPLAGRSSSMGPTGSSGMTVGRSARTISANGTAASAKAVRAAGSLGAGRGRAQVEGIEASRYSAAASAFCWGTVTRTWTTRASHRAPPPPGSTSGRSGAPTAERGRGCQSKSMSEPAGEPPGAWGRATVAGWSPHVRMLRLWRLVRGVIGMASIHHRPGFQAARPPRRAGAYATRTCGRIIAGWVPLRRIDPEPFAPPARRETVVDLLPTPFHWRRRRKLVPTSPSPSPMGTPTVTRARDWRHGPASGSSMRSVVTAATAANWRWR